MPTTEGELVIEIKTINDLNKSICYYLDKQMREIFVDNHLPDYDDFEELINEEVIEVRFNHYEVAGDFLNWRNMNNMDLEAVCDYVMTTEDNVFGEYTPQIPFNFRDMMLWKKFPQRNGHLYSR